MSFSVYRPDTIHQRRANVVSLDRRKAAASRLAIVLQHDPETLLNQGSRAADARVMIENIYHSFLQKRDAKGVGKQELMQALIKGWNRNQLPRVTRGMATHGNGFDLRIFHGKKVPNNFFDHVFEDDISGLVRPTSSNPRFSLYLEKLSPAIPTAPVPDDPDAFYVETLWLPNLNNDPKFNPITAEQNIKDVNIIVRPFSKIQA